MQVSSADDGCADKDVLCPIEGNRSSKDRIVIDHALHSEKFEAARPEMRASGFRDVDYVLTTRELARMLKQAGIRFEDLEPVPPDPVLSTYSGAGTIFGATGGVMEAALRTAYELKTGQALQKLEFAVVRGMEGIKEATIDVAGTPIKVAVAHGLGNARRLLDKVSEDKRQGKTEYHFIEIMACTGGCVGGGGQPIPNTIDVRMKRSDGLYGEDESLSIRKIP
jgi:NADH-quinone oxidoreductase subunit G/NADP-reducing hydrogenase subunit HndD